MYNLIKYHYEYGDWDALVADYTEDMCFIMPGQTDVLEGRSGFRQALEGIGDLLPPGFEITGLRHIDGDEEVVSILEWKSEKVPGGSQSAVLFKMNGGKVYEERWLVDTVQWKAAFW
jgi:ketosteroid isomerase-like protein